MRRARSARRREPLHSARRRREARRPRLVSRRRARAGDPRIHPLPQARRHARPRRADAWLFRRARLCRGARRHARLGRVRRPARGRISATRARRRLRGHRLVEPPALVRRQRRHDGQILGRLQRAAGRGAAAARAEGDHHRLLDRRPLRRRHPLHGRRAAQRQSLVGRDHARLSGAPARPRDRRRRLARRCGCSGSTPCRSGRRCG